MSERLREQMAKLRALAPELNRATDDANRIVQEVDKFLGELSLGVSVRSSWFHHELPEDWQQQDEEDEKNTRPPSTFSYLAYGRVNGDYRIHVAHVVEREPSDWPHARDVMAEDLIPWPSCPREEKLRAIQRLPELLEALVKQATILATEGAKTTSTVREILGAMQPEEAEAVAEAEEAPLVHPVFVDDKGNPVIPPTRTPRSAPPPPPPRPQGLRRR